MEDETKLKLQALERLLEKRAEERQISRINARDNSVNLAKGELDKDILKVKGGSTGADLTEPITRIKNTTEKIQTKVPQKLLSGDEFTEKIARLRALKKAAKSGLKALPIVGSVASLAMNPEDASAAIPGLDSAESVGESPEQEDMMLSETKARMDYEDSPAKRDRKAALAKLLNKGE